MSTRMWIAGILLTIGVVGQIGLAFLLYNEGGNDVICNIGWGILWLSAIFGWLPIFTFKKWGGVPKGKSYIETTQLVDRGVYAIVRHPQYLAGVLMGVALPLIAQHWLVAVLGIPVVAISYLGTLDEEKACIEKFGEDYERYMARVPQVNFVLGLLRWLRRRGTG